MFTLNHYIWLVICVIFIVASSILIKKFNPSFNLIFNIACMGCILSEFIKVFSVIEFDYIGEDLVPFIRNQHLPLHLCSIQIIFIFLVRFMSPNSKIRSTLLGFMYPTMIIGASLALLMPSIFSNSVPVSKAFISPHAYQFFLYHSMLVILGIYIMGSKEFNIKPKHYLSTISILSAFGFVSLYLNSIFAYMTYDYDTNTFDLLYTPDFFFTAKSPLAFLHFTEKWHWYLYMVVIVLIACSVIALFYLPIFIKAIKEKKKNKQLSLN